MRSKNYELTWKIRRSFKLLAALADQYLADTGIAARDRAVLEFIDSWGPSSVPDLARNFYVSRQNIQVRVNGLLRMGLLERRPNPAHRRSVLIALSRKGESLFRQIKDMETQIIEDLFAGIPNADVDAAGRTVSHLIDNLLTKLEPEEAP